MLATVAGLDERQHLRRAGEPERGDFAGIDTTVGTGSRAEPVDQPPTPPGPAG
jgi:hypothetical protein